MLLSPRRYSVVLCISLLPLLLYGNDKTEDYSHWLDLPSDTLLERGIASLASDTDVEKSLICYTIVGNRYHSGMSRAEATVCARAYIGKWLIYLTSYFDYAKSYESLLMAREIADANGLHLPRIDIAFGNLFQTMSEQSDNTALNVTAFRHYSDGFALAMQQCDYHNADLAFINMANVAYALGQYQLIDSCWQAYNSLPCGPSDTRRKYNHSLYHGLLAMSRGRSAEAIRLFSRQVALISEKPLEKDLLRPLCIAYLNLAEAYSMAGDYGRAAETLSVDLHFTLKHGLKDIRLDIYRYMSRYYLLMGDSITGRSCYDKYVHLKDSLLNSRQFAKVDELRFIEQMDRVGRRMAEIDHDKKMHATINCIFIVIVAIILIFTYVIYIKNRKLRRYNRMLYNKNVEVIRSEEKERAMRKRYEQQIDEFTSMSVCQTEEPVEGVKYKDSRLDDDDKQQLMQRILVAMENTTEVCSTDFTIERLAALAGSRQKYVSQVINECRGCNFNNFLNEYRIKEACRRMLNDPHYADFTIEAIANDVGFRSRSTFITSFKRFTGLTPSEYRWQAAR